MGSYFCGGWPEAGLILAEAAMYIATAPKSNSCYLAIKKATADLEAERTGEVPPHLRDASYKGASDLEHGKGYKYPPTTIRAITSFSSIYPIS